MITGMNSNKLDVIVIGAGHAGLSISYYLRKLNLDHLVFEKGSIGDTWLNQRWDSFKFNTPIKVNLLPGQENTLNDAEGFWSALEFVSLLEDYSNTFRLPVVENSQVLSVEKDLVSGDFSVIVSSGNGSVNHYRCKQVVVASGAQNRKFIPAFAGKISKEITQLHAGEYRNASTIPEGAVLVVGSAQSGVQIAEDLINSGRKVFISTSKVARVPRRYRGRDIVDWLIQTGFYDVHKKEVDDPEIFRSRFPQISGAGPQGHTLSLQLLAQKGATILGKAEDAASFTVGLQPDGAAHVKFADESSWKVKKTIDDYILHSGIKAPPPEEDPADVPDYSASCARESTALNLKGNNISCIIWTTGFASDFSYLKLPVFNGSGELKHDEGISDVEGLYFLGIPWLRKRKSGIILGINEDAEFIAEKLLINQPHNKKVQL